MAASTDLIALRPVRLRAAVALSEGFRGERPGVRAVGVGVVPTPQFERIEVELRGDLVEEALERERAFDETRSTERDHRWQIELRRVLRRAPIVARIEHFHRPLGRGGPAGEADGVDEVAAECDE